MSDWNLIGIALKSLLSKYNVDTSAIGTSQRLAYQVFESIFYHLFMIIDPSDCRRRFWSLYPARNQDEKSRFIDEATSFINNKHLNPSKVTSSQLRMCGGEPFRRLLVNLIKKASEIELNTNDKKTNQPDSSCDQSLPDILEELTQVKEILATKSSDLKISIQEYNQLSDRYTNRLEDKERLWSILSEHHSDEFILDGDRPIKQILKSILSKLEEIETKRRPVIKSILDIPVTREPPKTLDISTSRQNGSIRMSCLFSEIRQRLYLSPEVSKSSNAVETSDIINQLSTYDDGVNTLISIWEKERDKADEALLASREMQERYEFFQSLIPFIDLKSHVGDVTDSKGSINFPEVCEMLKSFPDPSYDDNEILKFLRSHFEE